MENEEGFKPILKPYQIVGVNFLLFMYRKRIAGGNCLLNFSMLCLNFLLHGLLIGEFICCD